MSLRDLVESDSANILGRDLSVTGSYLVRSTGVSSVVKCLIGANAGSIQLDGLGQGPATTLTALVLRSEVSRPAKGDSLTPASGEWSGRVLRVTGPGVPDAGCWRIELRDETESHRAAEGRREQR